jgi:aerobic carbon-monoxide dehydrogenase medium subunit
MRPFTYLRPTTAGEAATALAEHGEEAAVIAGGQTLLLAMKDRLSRPSVLVSLQDVAEAHGISYTDDGALAIGAATPYRELRHAELRAGHGLLATIASEVGDIPVQRMGTPGGALCFADPIFDFCLGAVSGGAEVELVSPSGTRTLPAAEFLQGAYATALEPGEVMTEIRFPAAGEGARSAFVKHRLRRFDPAIVSVACVLDIGGDGTVASARIACGGIGPVPVRAAAAEELVTGREMSDELAREAGARAIETFETSARHVPGTGGNGYKRFSDDYRREVLPTLVARALRAATDDGKE